MPNREKNIATLISSFNLSLDYIRKKMPFMTEDNYDQIKLIMSEVFWEWRNKSEQEIDDHVNELLVEAFGILWMLEAMHMLQQHKKEARG